MRFLSNYLYIQRHSTSWKTAKKNLRKESSTAFNNQFGVQHTTICQPFHVENMRRRFNTTRISEEFVNVVDDSIGVIVKSFQLILFSSCPGG
jgi:hypothetical protein